MLFSDTLSIAELYGLPVYARVFQAKLVVIQEVCWYLGHDLSSKCNIVILTHSRATIKVGQC